MTSALKLLKKGLVDLDSQFEVPFEVDGIAGVKLGRLQDFRVGNVLTEQGTISRRVGNLTCLREVWTPEVGQMVNVRGFQLRVEDVHPEELFYTAVLIESHQ